jgi:REP element-mobilizing transposase RayT
MKQIEFPNHNINPPSHGGKRRGAGRKSKVGEKRHVTRPQIRTQHPLHLTVRLRDGLPSLRKHRSLKRLQSFMRETQKFGLRINHFSVLKNHIHMIAEADGTTAVQRGMMSFNGRLGRWLRSLGVKPGLYPRGLFQGRYHLQVLKTPRQVKNALKYVLLNASKHFRKCYYIDQFY